MKVQTISNTNFINFWEFLGIPMNSPTRDIKLAFVHRFEQIEESIKKEDNKYTLEDLKICIKAYETLSDPYLRTLHNCAIDGEEPPSIEDWESYCSEEDSDLSSDENKTFLEWILAKAHELNDDIKNFMTISSSLYKLLEKEFNNLNSKQSKKKKKETKKGLSL